MTQNHTQSVARRRNAGNALRVTSRMELAPQFVIYALHVPYTLYLMLRYRGIMLPTVSNPGLETSGLLNESKSDLFGLLGSIGRAHLAPFVTICTGPEMLQHAEHAMREASLVFPVVVKPDIGRRGFGVKLVHTAQQLAQHLSLFQDGVQMMIQRYAEGPCEAGIFFMRTPPQQHGRVLSLTIKHFPEVTGDGTHSLRELILQDPRARNFARVYFKRNHKHLNTVLGSGERYKLVSIGNHVRGAAFENGSEHITPALDQVFDRIVGEVPGFYIGRFDVRYTSLEALKRGEGFTMVEYNGAGGEPTYIWDPSTSIVGTYAGLLNHWKSLYAIGAQNRRRGAKPITLRELLKCYLHERHLLKGYPDEE